MGLYVQQSGKHRGPDPQNEGKKRTYVVGDIVELTPEQASAFKDKFKSVEVVEAEAAVMKAQQLAIAKATLAQNPPQAKTQTQTAEPAPATGQTSVPSPSGQTQSPPSGSTATATATATK